MKKLFVTLMLITLAACTQSEQSNSGMMCEKCSCCQKMMEGKDGMKTGMQCPMMKGEKKDGMQCGCCKGMMSNMDAEQQPKQSLPKTAPSQDEHAQHH